MSASEAEATVAVEAAAKKVYEANAEGYNATMARAGLPGQPSWEDSNPLTKNQYREAVLPIVWAALEALPDRSRGLWLEGYYAHEVGIDENACPYA